HHAPSGTRMLFYSLFLFQDGRPVGNVARSHNHDSDAVADARNMCASLSVEVWHGDRLVARIPQGDEPHYVNDRYSGCHHDHPDTLTRDLSAVPLRLAKAP